MSGARLRYSVVIPVYNGRHFIAKAIESCLGQTMLPDEIIVIDDASTDETVSIVQSFQSPLIKIERNQKNRGPSFSRNKGMKLAESDWILFLDADDLFHPEKIRIVDDCIRSNGKIRAFGHSYNIAGLGGAHLGESVPIPERITLWQVLLKNPVVTPALCVRAGNDILFNEAMGYAEDHDFILRTAEQYGLWFIDLPLCVLQRAPLTGGGISSHKWKMRKGEMKMYMNYGKRNNRYLLIPFLLFFSLMKHGRQILFKRKHNAL